jgi:DNA-binding transcriptional ArsR family regulator
MSEEELVGHIPSVETIAAVSEAMKQLGDPSRLRIFWLLCHAEECVQNIASAMDMSSPAVSHHLRLLKSAGLIVSNRKGKEMFYRAADTDLVASLHHGIEQIASISCMD